MPVVACQSAVSEVRQLTHDVRELAFQLTEPTALPFLAGQYINFMVPAKDRPKPVSRLYSICSAPAERGVIRIVYNYVGGPGTSFLQQLEVGQAVTFKGPFGHFTLKEDSSRDILCVATGTGIAPFYSMAVEHLRKGCPRKMTVLWGVRHENDVYYQEEFRALEKSYPNFRLLMTLSQPADGWKGLRGRVTAIFPEHFPSVDNLELYCCGSDAMIGEITALAKARGECPVYREKYF